jgi:hypothetical protein
VPDFSMRRWGSALALTLVAVVTLVAWRAAPTAIPMRVVKSPTCTCCARWVDSMKHAGFAVTVEDKADFTALKRASGVGPSLESCHTAFVAGYVIEGHVPADLIRKLLAEKPVGIKGLTAPGMPASAPGMDMPGQKYTIYAFDGQGHTRVYAVR